MTTQLKELKGEIDELSKEIREEKKKRDNTDDVAEKGIILESIAVLNTRLDAARAHRHEITLRLPVPVPTPVRTRLSPPTLVSPLYTRTRQPPARCRVP